MMDRQDRIEVCTACWRPTEHGRQRCPCGETDTEWRDTEELQDRQTGGIDSDA